MKRISYVWNNVSHVRDVEDNVDKQEVIKRIIADSEGGGSSKEKSRRTSEVVESDSELKASLKEIERLREELAAAQKAPEPTPPNDRALVDDEPVEVEVKPSGEDDGTRPEPPPDKPDDPVEGVSATDDSEETVETETEMVDNVSIDPASPPFKVIKADGRGWYDVIGPDDKPITKVSMRKADAETMAAQKNAESG